MEVVVAFAAGPPDEPLELPVLAVLASLASMAVPAVSLVDQAAAVEQECLVQLVPSTAALRTLLSMRQSTPRADPESFYRQYPPT